MKKIHLLLLLLWPAFTIGQDFNQHLIGTTGAYTENANASLSWSIGETMVETFANSSYTLTQGFHQGSLSVTALINQPDFGVDISVYPNPVRSVLYIKTRDAGLHYKILNVSGEAISAGNFETTKSEINFSAFKPGIYFLQINKHKTHKIIKH